MHPRDPLIREKDLEDQSAKLLPESETELWNYYLFFINIQEFLFFQEFLHSIFQRDETRLSVIEEWSIGTRFHAGIYTRCFISGEEYICARGQIKEEGETLYRNGVKWRGTGDNLRSTIRPYNGDNVPHPTHAPFSTANIHPFTDVSLPAGQQLENYLYTRYSNSLFLAKTSLYIGLATK